jgi:biotin carboxyl carrier protein
MSHLYKVKVVLNGKPYVVELDGIAGPRIHAKVNGNAYDVEIGALATGTKPEVDARTVSERQSGEDSSVGAIDSGKAVIVAPMPGNITNIKASRGDVILKGQVLCTLEAMKMQNAIRSPRDGVIETVSIAAGQAVAYGDVLFTFE